MTDAPHGSLTPKGPVSGRRLGDLVPQGAIPATRCHATNRRGEQCGRWAIIGGSVCTSHGGGSPQAQAHAQARIRELVAPALTMAEQMLLDPATPPAVRQRLIADILDRDGLKSPDVLVQVTEQLERPDLDDALAKVFASRGYVVDVDEA